MSEEKKDDLAAASAKRLTNQCISPEEYENHNYPIPQESRIELVLGPTDPLLLKSIEKIIAHRPYSKEERRQAMWDNSRQTCEVCGVKMATSVLEKPKKCEQCSRR